MEKKFAQLTPAEIEAQRIQGYLFIEVATKINHETGKPYLNTDWYFSDYARASRPLILESDKLRPLFNILHLGGGMAQSEIYRTDLIVDDNSTAIFTTQSSTKVLQCLPNTPPTRYHVNMQVGENGMLEFINDSLIMYDDARYEQTTDLYVTKTSTAIYTEIIGPGWSQSGEDHTYNMMHLQMNVYCDDRLLLFDNLLFEPGKSNPSTLGVLDQYRRCGTGIFICPQITPEVLDKLRETIREKFPNDNKYYELGISSLGIPSAVVRVLADEAFEIQHILSAVHQYVREELLHLPMINLRKP